MPTILVNADDFGLHRDIDRGILDCIDAGVVQSISFSPQGESLDWNQLIALRRQGVRVGLHITLVGEPWMTDGRIIPGWKDLIQQIALPTRSGEDLRRDVEREIERQIRVTLDRQIPISHIDSHQHVHAFPWIARPMLAAVHDHRIPRIRVAWCPSWWNIKKTVSGVALQFLSQKFGKRVGRFLPILGIAHAGRNTTEIYRREIAHAKNLDVELCVHPGHSTPALQRKYSEWNFDWRAERDALLDPKFKQIVVARGYTFAPMLPELSVTAA